MCQTIAFGDKLVGTRMTRIMIFDVLRTYRITVGARMTARSMPDPDNPNPICTL